MPYHPAPLDILKTAYRHTIIFQLYSRAEFENRSSSVQHVTITGMKLTSPLS